jgi:hypothetical protein
VFSIDETLFDTPTVSPILIDQEDINTELSINILTCQVIREFKAVVTRDKPDWPSSAVETPRRFGPGRSGSAVESARGVICIPRSAAIDRFGQYSPESVSFILQGSIRTHG